MRKAKNTNLDSVKLCIEINKLLRKPVKESKIIQIGERVVKVTFHEKDKIG